MMTTRDPETMTADERRKEVASILAIGLLRCLRTPNLSASGTRLDLPAKTRLSVAQQPYERSYIDA